MVINLSNCRWPLFPKGLHTLSPCMSLHRLCLSHFHLRLLMGLNPPQIRPYPYFKSPNYHPPRPTPSAQCPNPPQPEVTMEDDMRLTCRSTTIAPQPVYVVNPTRPNPFHSVTRFHLSNNTRIKTHPKKPVKPSPLAGVPIGHDLG